jgi:hypothetical protein
MIGASLLLALQFVGQSPPSTNPHVLLEQLGAARYAEREAAARALESMGREAISVLQDARESRDIEIRTRAAALLQQIEGSLLTRPTMIWFNFDKVPLASVAQALSQQTGMKISLVPENLPRWKEDRFSLHETLPLPFWMAVDRLCAAGLLNYEVELSGFKSGCQPTLALTDRDTHSVHPVFDHGPFRVGLVRLEFHRNVEFAATPLRPRGNAGLAEPRMVGQELASPKPRPIARVQCLVQLEVTAEPRMTISQAGALQILEACDERGNSLRIDGAGTSALNPSAEYLASSCSSVVHVGVPLNHPDNPGRTIRILRGSIPLRITARQGNPLVVPLAAAGGRVFESNGQQLSVHEVRDDPDNRQRQIELTIRTSRTGRTAASDEDTVPDLGSRFEPHLQHIEIIDTQGHVIPWFETSSDMEASRVTLTMAGSAGVEPKEMRYYHLTETVVNVPFSFSEVPMP